MIPGGCDDRFELPAGPKGKGTLQFFNIVYHPEAALGIRVVERIGTRGCGWRALGAHCMFNTP